MVAVEENQQWHAEGWESTCDSLDNLPVVADAFNYSDLVFQFRAVNCLVDVTDIDIISADYGGGAPN